MWLPGCTCSIYYLYFIIFILLTVEYCCLFLQLENQLVLHVFHLDRKNFDVLHGPTKQWYTKLHLSPLWRYQTMERNFHDMENPYNNLERGKRWLRSIPKHCHKVDGNPTKHCHPLNNHTRTLCQLIQHQCLHGSRHQMHFPKGIDVWVWWCSWWCSW